MPEKPFKDGGKDTEGGVDVFAKMGLEVFTIPQLQDALGFSYQPAYRLLHGYTNGKGTYTGILDKCPAISPIDATVGEMLAGMEIKRREKYFSFDATIYREWMKHADVWLKPDDTDGHADSDNTDNGNDGNNGNNGNNGNDENHVFTFSPRLHQKMAKSENENNEQNDVHSLKGDSNNCIYIEGTSPFHPNPVSYSNPVSPVEGSPCMGDGRIGENEPDKMADSPLIPIQDANSPPLKKKQKCNRVKTGERVKTKKAGTTLSLPNIIDHQRFQRSAVSLGHCSLCGEGAAMYHSKEQRASICEKCYARLVREWNRGEGVV